jgi:hypothetical protein
VELYDLAWTLAEGTCKSDAKGGSEVDRTIICMLGTDHQLSHSGKGKAYAEWEEIMQMA